ncbi:MAG: VOC family protein [Myxococcales bacterium]|nr:VOC family protein [Myxococcales bacterium]MCB9707411.1 VOC family protein [Myxococcales bacterium]
MTNRPFRVLGVQQIAIGGLDRMRLRELWVDLLGFDSVGQFRSEGENVDEEILTLSPQGGLGLEIDLMQPIDPARKPHVHDPALNHIGLWVDDIDAAYAWLSSKGVRMADGGIREGAHGRRVCFIHPKPNATHPSSGQGVLIELVQAGGQ